MSTRGLASLVGAIAESFGQSVREVKQESGATYLATPDGFLYIFLEDPERAGSIVEAEGLSHPSPALRHLVVLSSLALPAEAVKALESAGVTLVAGERFQRLLESLDLATGGPPSSSSAPSGAQRRALPTADLLDSTMDRARVWMEWGVPAIALRFFRRAAQLKPEYLPALRGIAHAYLALGFPEDAEQAFQQVLALHPGDWEAKVGRARVHGLRGDHAREIRMLRELHREAPEVVLIRAHLVAALIDAGRWAEARPHLEALCALAPEDPLLHALLSRVLEHVGDAEGARREAQAAEERGMTPEELQRYHPRPPEAGRSTGGGP